MLKNQQLLINLALWDNGHLQTLISNPNKPFPFYSPMILDIQRSSQRGKTTLDWLDSRHSFSFGDYYNPKRRNFGALVVQNDDIIQPSSGFGVHPHRNMEIITVMLEGTLKHQDSMGNTGIIQAGEVQVMSAGTGVEHAETNHSKKERVHLLQIWIQPRVQNLTPRYEQKKFVLEKNKLNLLVSDSRSKDSLMIAQRAKLLRGVFDAGQTILYEPQHENGVYVFVISGKIHSGKEILEFGDALATDEKVELMVNMKADIIVMEVPLQ